MFTRLIDPFLRALRRAAARAATEDRVLDEGAMWSVSLHASLLARTPKRDLGTLLGYILCQAADDGVTRVSFSFHNNQSRMIYALDGNDYDMVPPPLPAALDLARELIRASGATFDRDGRLKVSLWGNSVNLRVSVECSSASISISGFDPSVARAARNKAQRNGSAENDNI